MRTRALTINATQDGRTVKSILANELRLSDGLISRVKLRPNGILCNGKKVYTTAIVRAGDRLCIEVGDDPSKSHILPMPHPLRVLWEDEDIIIIDKPAGLSVHQSTRDREECTVENALAAMLPYGDIPHPVSRLDRGTTGIMTLAKNGYMHELLRQIMHTDGFFREYRGVACGTVFPPHGKIDLPIGFADHSTYKRAICQNGAASLTEYQTLRCENGYTLLRLIPHTGRTHQLRLHMSAIGYPLAGDWLYGTENHTIIDRPALHSAELFLTHPLSGEKLHITSPLPKDMQHLIEKS